MIDDLARKRGVVVRDRKIDVRMLVWTLVVSFAVGGEARSIAGYRRAYETATDQTLVPSSFYDRFTEELATLLRDLLDGVVEEVAVPHTLAPAFEQFRDVIAVDATILRLCRFLPKFKATHADESGLTLYLVHNVTEQSVISVMNERIFESGCRRQSDGRTLFCRLAECVDGDTIDEAVDWCPDEVQGTKKPVGPSGLLQALLGQAPELRQPRLH